MRQVYKVLANLVALTVLVQVASIALAWFTVLHDVDGGQVFTSDDDNYGHVIHSFGAIAIAVFALLLLIVSFFAKVDGGVKWAGLVFLAVLVQWLLAIVSFEVPVVGALHGLNALVIAGVASAAARRVTTPKKEPEPATA